MNIKDIIEYVVSRETDSRCENNCYRDTYIFYDLRRTETTVELPLGIRWSNSLNNRIKVGISCSYNILPKTALRILNNTIGAQCDYLTSCRESTSGDIPILYKSVYGLITDALENPLIEFTKRYNFVTNTTEKYILRINKNFLKQENNALSKYIKGSVIKTFSVESILGVDIDIIISTDISSPLIQATSPLSTREAHMEEIHRVLTSHLETFTNTIVPSNDSSGVLQGLVDSY